MATPIINYDNIPKDNTPDDYISPTTGIDTEGSTYWQENKGNILTGIVKGLGNFVTGIFGNKKRRQQSLDDYNMQRKDALSDWDRQNQYDHPTQQMQRLKEAGLNPHLVYGNGAVGNTSGQVNSVKKDTPNTETPQINQDSLYNYIDLEAKKAQIDLLKKQSDLMDQEIIYKAVSTNNVAQDVYGKQFDYGVKNELRDTTIAFSKENLRKLQLEMGLSINQDKRAQNLTNAQIQQIRTNIKSQGYDIEFKRLENILQQAGIYKTDPIFMRILLQTGENPAVISKIIDNIKNLGSEAIKAIF